jgi:tetratricopeptide (TPR) repeat protein
VDPRRPVIQLCIAGTQAEFQGHPAEAASLYHQAWETAQDDVERCIAAHYVARFQPSPGEALHWNKTALLHAQAAPRTEVDAFFPSLYLCLGRSYEQVGDLEKAQACYAQARQLGVEHQLD